MICNQPQGFFFNDIKPRRTELYLFKEASASQKMSFNMVLVVVGFATLQIGHQISTCLESSFP